MTIEDCLAWCDYFVTTKEESEGLAGARDELATLRAKAEAWDRLSHEVKCQFVVSGKYEACGHISVNAIEQFELDHPHA